MPIDRVMNTVKVLLVLVCALLNLEAAVGQGVNNTLQLGNKRSWEQSVLVAPYNIADSLYFNGSYVINQNNLGQLSSSRNPFFIVPGNETLVFGNFFISSCITLNLTSSDSRVYAFVTDAAVWDGFYSDVYFDSTNASLISTGPVSNNSLPGNTSESQSLALSGGFAYANSGTISVNTLLYNYITIVVVNPTLDPKNVSLNVAISPYGPCQMCNKQQNAQGNLGNCSLSQTNIVQDSKRDSAVSVASWTLPLVPVQWHFLMVAPGESGLYSVFTNASCMFYAVLAFYSNGSAVTFSPSNPLLTAWVSSSEDQNAIIHSSSVTSQQMQSFPCSFPATTNGSQLCFNYTSDLDPTGTYSVWIENISSGNLTVYLEVIILGNASACSRGSFFNISGYSSYLNSLPAQAPSGSLLSPPPSPWASIANNQSLLSPFDPSVVPGSFRGSINQTSGYYYNVYKVGSDGALHLDGVWNFTAPQQSGSTVTYAKVTENMLDPYNYTFLEDSFFDFDPFSNAACASVSLNASGPVNSSLYTAADLSTYGSFSPQLEAVANSTVNLTTGTTYLVNGLSPNETYLFAISNGSQSTANISLTSTKYPPGSPICNKNSLSALSPAGSAGNAVTTAARGGYYQVVYGNSSQGGSDSTGAVTGAACIAFALSARGPLDTPNVDFDINSTGTSSNFEFNASAILLDSDANRNFLTSGFIGAGSNTTLNVSAGCSLNAYSPGPCYSYKDNLDRGETYFIWAVIGAATPSTWFLASFEALPSGSCQNLYSTPLPSAATTPGIPSSPPPPPPSPRPPPPSPPPPPPPSQPPPPPPSQPPPPPSPSPPIVTPASSSSTPIGAIVGGVAGGVVAAVAAVCIFGFARLGWFRKKESAGLGGSQDRKLSGVLGRRKSSLPSSHKATDPFFITDTGVATDRYIHYRDIKTNNFATKMPSTVFHMPVNLSSSDAMPYKSKAATGSSAGGKLSRGGSSSGDLGSGQPNTPRSDDLSRLQDQWEIDLSNLRIKASNDGLPIKLGEGGCGVVLLGLLGIREVAVKEATGKSPSQKQAFLHEINILKSCRDPAIVQFLGASVSVEQTVLLMEYMPGGDLYRRLQSPDREQFLWYKRGKRIAMDVAKGLYYLHSRNILHLDMKSPNILLTENLEAKISDVGLAKITSADGTAADGGVSLMWASPEQLGGGNCMFASDMFSFGIILWEICTGDSPSRSRTFREVEVPREAPRAVADLILNCMLPHPMDRPTAQEAHAVLKRSSKIAAP